MKDNILSRGWGGSSDSVESFRSKQFKATFPRAQYITLIEETIYAWLS